MRNTSLDAPLFAATGTHPGEATAHLHQGPAQDAYPTWPTPDVIVSDGAYGINGFPGDPATPDGLPDWYAPHLDAWTAAAKPSTVLFFWNTEAGWATMHPQLLAAGWEYVQLVVWDKGIGHIAGNVNSATIRRFPVVTEVCGIYTRPAQLTPTTGDSVQSWLRAEWARTGLPWRAANTACGVKEAATRKYLAADHVWYPPPAPMFARLVEYANTHGNPDGAPYFAPESRPETEAAWESLRYQWNHVHGLTNVWTVPTLRGSERIKHGTAAAHANQKPLELMRRCIHAVGAPGDIAWEPFGGTGTATVAAVEAGRSAYVAEPNPEFATVLWQRLLRTMPAPARSAA